MSRASVEPPNVSAATIPLTAAVDILAGQALAIDPATGNAVIQDAEAFPSINHIIGLSINSAKAGQIVYVQVFGIVTVPRNGGGAIGIGSFVFSAFGQLFDGTNDAAGLPIVGVCLAQTAHTTTILVMPRAAVAGINSPNVSPGSNGATINTSPAGTLNLFDAAGDTLSLGEGTATIAMQNAANNAFMEFINTGEVQISAAAGAALIDMLASGEIDITATVLKLNGSPIGGVPNFADSETPATFNTNADYDLLRAPNPLLSLQVFINSEAVPKPGQDRLLVQGVDYSLTTGAHGPNTRIHYLVTPTATNTIRCWYRY